MSSIWESSGSQVSCRRVTCFDYQGRREGNKLLRFWGFTELTLCLVCLGWELLPCIILNLRDWDVIRIDLELLGLIFRGVVKLVMIRVQDTS